MSDKPILTLLAEPGWFALAIQYNEAGERVRLPDGLFSVMATNVYGWALTLEARGLVDLFGSGGNLSAHPVDEHGERLDRRRGYMGLQEPGEIAQESVDRIEAPFKQIVKERAAKGGKRRGR